MEMYGETFEASEIVPGFLWLGSDESAICSAEILKAKQHRMFIIFLLKYFYRN